LSRIVKRRRRRLRARPGQLVAYWGFDQDGEGPDLCVVWGGNGAQKADGRFLLDMLSKEHIRQLSARGYDLSTLKFTVARLTPPAPVDGVE
jgi:hypothetical protein